MFRLGNYAHLCINAHYVLHSYMYIRQTVEVTNVQRAALSAWFAFASLRCSSSMSLIKATYCSSTQKNWCKRQHTVPFIKWKCKNRQRLKCIVLSLTHVSLFIESGPKGVDCFTALH